MMKSKKRICVEMIKERFKQPVRGKNQNKRSIELKDEIKTFIEPERRTHTTNKYRKQTSDDGFTVLFSFRPVAFVLSAVG